MSIPSLCASLFQIYFDICLFSYIGYVMEDLLQDRVKITRPFTNVGIDYCGPFFHKGKEDL